MIHHKTILLFLLLLISEILALYCVKKSSVNKDKKWLFYSCIFYSLVPIFLYFILRKTHKIGSLNSTWNIVSSIYGVLLGVLIFSEIYTPKQCLGIFFGILALILMNM